MKYPLFFWSWLLGAAAIAACADGLPGDAALPSVAPPAPPVNDVKANGQADAESPIAVDDAATQPTDDGSSTTSTNDAAAAADVTVTADTSIPPPIVLTPPVLDGTISAGEYGLHADGQNQQASDPANASSTTWYLTWSETHLYVGVSAANTAEGVVLYIDHTPLTPSNSGTNADGSLVGNVYDNTKPGALPFRADFAVYFKAGYNEYRTADGANGWSAQTAGMLTVPSVGTQREVAIPWSIVRAAGRPSSFAWVGYATSAAGWVYGAMPPNNAAGNIGQNATLGSFYKVMDATPVIGTKPFAMKLVP